MRIFKKSSVILDLMFLAIPRKNIVSYKGEFLDLIKVIFSGKILKGDKIGVFQKKFSEYLGAKNVFFVSSGRFGLELILRSIGIKEGDEVILPAYTFHAVPRVLIGMGIKPVFVDVERNYSNIDASLIKKKITKNTKAVIATHIFGVPCDITRIKRICNEKGLFLIEDCAQALGASVKGKKVGNYGDASFFSFESVKPLNTYGGGGIITNDTKIAKRLKSFLKNIKYPKKTRLLKKIITCYIEKAIMSRIIFSFFVYPFLLLGLDVSKLYKSLKKSTKVLGNRYTNIQATIGFRKLDIIDKIINSNRDHIRLLSNKLKDKRFDEKVINSSVFYEYVINARNGRKLSRSLLFKGIDTEMGMVSNCVSMFNYKGEYPVTESSEKGNLQIPAHHNLSRKEVAYIADCLRSLKNDAK